MAKTKTEKLIEKEFKNMPKIKVKDYTLEKIEKTAHVGSNCPQTEKPYKENIGGYERWFHRPLSGGGGHRITCSECGEFLGNTTGIRY